MTVELEVICDCGMELDTSVGYAGRITVTPCDRCLAEERDEAYREGKEEGFREGEIQGYRTGQNNSNT
jgi:hypothetical protein